MHLVSPVILCYYILNYRIRQVKKMPLSKKLKTIINQLNQIQTERNRVLSLFSLDEKLVAGNLRRDPYSLWQTNLPLP